MAYLELRKGDPPAAARLLAKGVRLLRRGNSRLIDFVDESHRVERLVAANHPDATHALARLLVLIHERWPLGQASPFPR